MRDAGLYMNLQKIELSYCLLSYIMNTLFFALQHKCIVYLCTKWFTFFIMASIQYSAKYLSHQDFHLSTCAKGLPPSCPSEHISNLFWRFSQPSGIDGERMQEEEREGSPIAQEEILVLMETTELDTAQCILTIHLKLYLYHSRLLAVKRSYIKPMNFHKCNRLDPDLVVFEEVGQ